MRLNLYTVDSNYFDFLRKFEPRVPFVKENRPFLGIVLQVNYRNYFAPLSSPKEKHIIMHEQRDLIKIDEGELGVINLNNMIPIPMSRCIRINLDNITDNKYRTLLKKQFIWCNKNSKEITKTAEKLYNSVCYSDNKDSMLKKRCCDFKLLERKCIEFMKVNTLNEEEFIYQIS